MLHIFSSNAFREGISVLSSYWAYYFTKPFPTPGDYGNSDGQNQHSLTKGYKRKIFQGLQKHDLRTKGYKRTFCNH